MTAWWRKEQDRNLWSKIVERGQGQRWALTTEKDKKNLTTTKKRILNFTCVTLTSPE